ncbi:hypothetical protein BSL78_27031 [Apostichopus japonicus]|uniref:Uncharacterized protein n=1 Tax=Stichopus japonicus TaxID=307972 RepID=A0A2G8JK66_STIJA|nr:hypothetical protein BSL78_27031 [Apostichopus japonicus]
MTKATLNNCAYLKSNRISMDVNLHLTRALLASRLTYGCSTWTIKAADMNRLDALGREIWRRLLRLTWKDHVSNDELNTKIAGRWLFSSETVLQHNAKWFGHSVRCGGLTCAVLCGLPCGYKPWKEPPLNLPTGYSLASSGHSFSSEFSDCNGLITEGVINGTVVLNQYCECGCPASANKVTKQAAVLDFFSRIHRVGSLEPSGAQGTEVVPQQNTRSLGYFDISVLPPSSAPLSSLGGYLVPLFGGSHALWLQVQADPRLTTVGVSLLLQPCSQFSNSGHLQDDGVETPIALSPATYWTYHRPIWLWSLDDTSSGGPTPRASTIGQCHSVHRLWGDR